MAVKSFCTNNLVAEHDMYEKFIKYRSFEIANDGANTAKLFYKDGLLNGVVESSSSGTQTNFTIYSTICKWHCITLAYDIWYKIVKDRAIDSGSTSYKKFVDVPETVLKKFKHDFAAAIETAGCDYNKRINRKHGTFDACRYLAIFWTYLDCIKDTKTQRFFPTQNTMTRAAEVFGYDKGDNPFAMNGKYYHRIDSENDIKTTGRVINAIPPEKVREIVKAVKPTMNDLDISISILDLTTKTYNALIRSNIRTLGDILRSTPNDLLKIRNFGNMSLSEIFRLADRFGYKYPNNDTPCITDNGVPLSENYNKASLVVNAQKERDKLLEELHIANDHIKTIEDRLANAEAALKCCQDEKTEITLKFNDMKLRNTKLLEKLKETNGVSADPIDLAKTLATSLSANGVSHLNLGIGGYVMDIQQKFIITTRKDGLNA